MAETINYVNSENRMEREVTKVKKKKNKIVNVSKTEENRK